MHGSSLGALVGITDLWAYALGALFIILLPGPNSLYVLSVAAQRGVRAGYAGASGIFVGDTVLMTLAALGGASVLRASPQVFLVVKAIGATYLAWIGIGLLRSAWQTWMRRDAPATGADRPVDRAVDARQPFRKALVVSLLNPKAIIFLLSFFIQFVDPAYPRPAISFLVLGTIIQIFSFAYLTALILAGARLARAFRARRRVAAATSAGVGALFLGFGAKLATASV